MRATKIPDGSRKPDELRKIVWLACFVVGSAGFTGCSQPTVVPPTAAISPSKRPSISIPQPIEQPTEPLSPPSQVIPQSQLPIDPITSNNAWKPEAEVRKWEYVVLHHTASDAGSVESIHQEHLKRKDKNGNAWMGIGYHFVIGNGNGMDDGEIEPTFRWRQQLQGAHAGVADYNQHGIGIVLIGNFDRSPPTEAQTAAVKKLISFLKREYGIANSSVIGHSDVKATECPGKFFPLNQVRDAVTWNGNHAAKNRIYLAAGSGAKWRPPFNDDSAVVNNGEPADSCVERDAKIAFAVTNLPGELLK